MNPIITNMIRTILMRRMLKIIRRVSLHLYKLWLSKMENNVANNNNNNNNNNDIHQNIIMAWDEFCRRHRQHHAHFAHHASFSNP